MSKCIEIWLDPKENSSVKETKVWVAQSKQLKAKPGSKSHDLWLYPVVMDILRSGNKETGNLPQASRENSSVSPLGASRLEGRLAIFHAQPSGDFQSPIYQT